MLRSSGDPPNGVIGVSMFGEPSWVVHPSVQLPDDARERSSVHYFDQDPFDGGAVKLTPDEVVGAAADDDAVAAIWRCLAGSLMVYVDAFEAEKAGRICTTLLTETRDALAEHGYIGSGE